MGTIKYSVHETPNPRNDGRKKYHVRPVNDRLVKIDKLTTDINEISSFSSSDVKGMLEAFSTIMKRYLSEGATVELEGIGTFSISLACPNDIANPSDIKASNIQFKKVNFKSSASLNNALRGLEFTRYKNNTPTKSNSEEERQKRILDYLKSEGSILSSSCMSLNNCNRYVALKDLNKLLTSGKITKNGNRASSIYFLKK